MLHILLKFISRANWAESFLDGELYMNTLHFFWNEYKLQQAEEIKREYIRKHPFINPDKVVVKMDKSLPDDEIRRDIPGTVILEADNKLAREQEDILEGTIATTEIDFVKQDLGEHLAGEPLLRSVGYQYCNVCCFYMYGINCIPNMDSFGPYVAIIKDPDELIRRVDKAVGGYQYICGPVEYKDPIEVHRHHVLLKTDTTIDFNGNINRDCFTKIRRYSDQREWRVALYRGVKETDAYTLKLGRDIRDIACVVKKEDLDKTIYDLKKRRQICFGNERYDGNVSRQEMKELFHQLGDHKVEVFSTLG